MIQSWQLEELQEQIGQGARLVNLVYDNPDNAELWSKLKAWATEHKGYVSESYEVPNEPKGYDISQLDGDPDNLKF